MDMDMEAELIALGEGVEMTDEQDEAEEGEILNSAGEEEDEAQLLNLEEDQVNIAASVDSPNFTSQDGNRDTLGIGDEQISNDDAMNPLDDDFDFHTADELEVSGEIVSGSCAAKEAESELLAEDEVMVESTDNGNANEDSNSNSGNHVQDLNPEDFLLQAGSEGDDKGIGGRDGEDEKSDNSNISSTDFVPQPDGDNADGDGDKEEGELDEENEWEGVQVLDDVSEEEVDPFSKKEGDDDKADPEIDDGGSVKEKEDSSEIGEKDTPEVIDIDKDGEEGNGEPGIKIIDFGKSKGGEDVDKDKEESEEDDEGSRPMIRMKSDIFESQPDEDEDEDGELNESTMDPEDIQSMMEVEMDEGDGDGILQGILKKKKLGKAEELVVRRAVPRRAAAQAAANTIKKISNLELNEPSEADPEYSESSGAAQVSASDGDKHRCVHCKTMASSLIVVRQYGTDIHLCSNSCFNSFRNPDPSKRPLPCAKCGNLNRDTENATVYYWETMNFCSDVCVGNFQVEIGAKCSTCLKRVAWQSLGKYCVRFGSDIRQFCTASCLESYKKNARVCFHCQLDIKRLGSVVMANIPSKNIAKEFCGQDCVEMYVEQNLHQPTRVKSAQAITCCICSTQKTLDRELVISPSIYQICGDKCWQQLLESQNIKKATKCETCPKYINMEYIKPAFYVATDKKSFGFCSATCKNVFVLKHRQILSCTNCKVKKYNYDLIQSVTGVIINFAVCSLNCLPKPSPYIFTLKENLNPPHSASEIIARTAESSTPVISSVTSLGTNTSNQNGVNDDLPIQISSVSSLAETSSIGVDPSELTNGGPFRYNDGSDSPSLRNSGSLTLRHVTEDDIIEIRDDDQEIIPYRHIHENGISDDFTEELLEPPAINDDRWMSSDVAIMYGKRPKKLVNKSTSARPLLITKETQSDSDELWAMPRIEMKIPPEEKIIYVPVPIPYPVYLPFPCYALDKPVPIPFPVGIPMPIPIPVDTRFLEISENADSSSQSVANSSKDDKMEVEESEES